MKQLILGGARSGKSRYAEQQALDHAGAYQQAPLYIATATMANDSEMAQRIAHHQHSRDQRWQLLEEPLELAQVIKQYATKEHCLLIDCLTLWLTNALMQQCWPRVKDELLEAISASSASLFLVSNEVGSGIVPLGELSRQFVDEAGWLHQALAQQCDEVNLIVAGLPLPLKKV